MTGNMKQTASTPWTLEMKGISVEEPGPLARSLTTAILASGGWVLSRAAQDTGQLNLLFEFERRACVEIYSTLIGAGVEFGQHGHIRFINLCRNTLALPQESQSEIASIDLEIHTFPMERTHASRAGLLT